MSESVFDPEVYGEPVYTDTQFDTEVYGELQDDIGTIGFGQAQASILQIYSGFAQAQTSIKQVYNAHAQAQAYLLRYGFGQAQSNILQSYQVYAQAQGYITSVTVSVVGQSQADILAVYNSFAQAQSSILQVYLAFSQAQACIVGNGFAQAQAQILQVYNSFSQAQASILQVYQVYGQAQAAILQTYTIFAQAQSYIIRIENQFSQAQGTIVLTFNKFGQAQAQIKTTYIKVAQSTALIDSYIKVYSANSAAFISKSVGYGQALALIIVLKGWAQGQAQIKLINNRRHAQARAYITKTRGHGQSQADIKKTTRNHANALGLIDRGGKGFATAQAQIYSFKTQRFAQAAAWIGTKAFGQANANIAATTNKFAQAQARIKLSNLQKFGQANSVIAFNGRRVYANSQGAILTFYNKFGQSQAHILGNTGYAQARALIVYAPGTVLLNDTFTRVRGVGTGLGTPDIGPDWQAHPDVTPDGLEPLSVDGSRAVFDYSIESDGDLTFGWAWVFNPISISDTNFYGEFSVGNSNAYFEFALRDPGPGTGIITWQYFGDWSFSGNGVVSPPTSNLVLTINTMYSFRFLAQGRSVKFKVWLKVDPEPSTWLLEYSSPTLTLGSGGVAIYLENDDDNTGGVYTYFDNINVQVPYPIPMGHAASIALIDSAVKISVGQASTTIIKVFSSRGQSRAVIITPIGYKFAQANAYILSPWQLGQAQATIFNPWAFGNAKALIFTVPHKIAQAQAYIKGYYVAQAQALITHAQNGLGQAQAFIGKTYEKVGQAQSFVTNTYPTGQARALIDDAKYFVSYNGYQLPGYAQEESIDSPMLIKTWGSPYRDIDFSEYMGLENKLVSLRMTVIGENYLDCKNQIELAGTIVRTNRSSFERLYIQYNDRYFEALTKTIKREATAKNVKTADYTVEFECKPWLVSNVETTISGVSTIETVGRDIYDGGWTPTRVEISGTNVTVSGYLATGEPTGFISVSGSVTSFVIDTGLFETTDNSAILNTDYQLYVGPGVTYFEVTGATECTITYQDRWYL